MVYKISILLFFYNFIIFFICYSCNVVINLSVKIPSQHSKFGFFCPCFDTCKSLTFYNILYIVHDRNLKHNYKLIYDIEINLHLNMTIYLYLFYKKIILFILILINL